MFYTYNNVAIFNADVLEHFPIFLQKTAHYPSVSLNLTATDVIVALIDSEYPITLEYFSNISSVNGLCILQADFLITYLHANAIKIKKHLINVITSVLTHALKCRILLSEPDFDQQLFFFSHSGFLDPKFYNDPPSVELNWSKQVHPSITISSINRIVSSLKKDRAVLNLVISPYLASTLSKIIHFMNEGSGLLFITNYTQNGEGMLGVNSNYISEGETDMVLPPPPLTPFQFHSHPDRITMERKAFIAWPSGQDMKNVAESYFTTKPQLVHIVISPEGLWIIMMSYEYQHLCNRIIENNLSDVSERLLDGIYNVFTNLEQYRVTDSVDPLHRHQSDQHYLIDVSNVRMGTILPDVSNEYYKYPIFKLNYFKWSVFEHNTNGIVITSEYLPTANIGAYIPPYNPYTD